VCAAGCVRMTRERSVTGTRRHAARAGDAGVVEEDVEHAEALSHGVEDAAQLLDATGYSHEEVRSQLGAPTDTLVTPPVTAFVRPGLVG